MTERRRAGTGRAGQGRRNQRQLLIVGPTALLLVVLAFLEPNRQPKAYVGATAGVTTTHGIGRRTNWLLQMSRVTYVTKFLSVALSLSLPRTVAQ